MTLEVLTLELLFLLHAPLTSQRELERDVLGPGQDQFTSVQIWWLEGCLQVPWRQREACDSAQSPPSLLPFLNLGASPSGPHRGPATQDLLDPCIVEGW